ncbi:MAG TPA: MarR family transcriptional regulator [Microbacteriaceae bacterium]|nr:MarR family transcriptional regulator [Microbacteriaceae bacterium]
MTERDARGADLVGWIQAQWERERPDLDVSPIGVIGRLHRLAARLDEELLLVYARYELGEGEFDVLATLRRSGEPYELVAGEIARYTIVTTGTVTKRVDRLEAAGLVTRRPSADDGRVRVVALTEAGVRVIDAAFTAHMRNEHRLLEAISLPERAQLEAIFKKWLAAFDA